MLAPGGDIAIDAMALQGLQILCGAVAGIGREFVGLGARVGLDAPEHAGELRGSRPLGIEMMGDDDLVRGIDRDLGVVALDEAVGGLQDP
jgi:hypothetical protein